MDEELLDSEGNPSPYPPGTRVVFLPDKREGSVIKQTLHYDCGEEFWGNLLVQMDDGMKLHCNCWQTRKL